MWLTRYAGPAGAPRTQDPHTPAVRRTLLLFCAVATAYAVASQLAWSWFGADGLSASFFPAAGVTLGALVLTGPRRWHVVLGAAFAAEMAVNLGHGMDAVPSLGYGVANTVQPLVAAALLYRVTPGVDIGRTRDLVAFFGAGVVAGPAVGGLLGALTFTALGDGEGFLRFATQWWVGDGLGVLVVGGGILSWRAASGRPRTSGRIAETVLLAVAAGTATAVAFWTGTAALGYVALVGLMAAGFRAGTRGVALTGTVVAFVAGQAIASGHDALDVVSISDSAAMTYFQLALAVLVGTAYLLAATIAERERDAADSRAAERFAALADRAPAMLWTTDRTGRCTYLSRGWYEFTGQDPADGLERGWLNCVHPRDTEGVRQAFEWASANREPFQSDYRLRRADGTFRRVIDAARPVYDADGGFAGMVGSVIDVHERVEAEDALRSSDARFRVLFEAIDEGYCLCEMIVDADGHPVDYRFLEANHLFGPMSGLHDAVGRTARELVPALEGHWFETYARVAFDGETVRFEEGSEAMGRWFDVFATPVAPRGRFALVFTDITERRRAEIALREREAQERRARRRAEFLAGITGELEAVDGVRARAERLVDLLVPRVADAASLILDGTVVAAAASGRWTDVRSEARVPVAVDDRGESALVVTLSDPARRPYDAADRAFVSELAGRVGLLLASARVHEEEHRVALSLQRALLPQIIDVHPSIEVAARYAAASGTLEVGGDWYDVFRLPDGRTGIAVGDVVGHGLESAATMGRLRTALAALAPHAGGPADLLRRLQQFTEGPAGTRFATACYAVLDTRTGVLEHASAGHPPCLVIAPGGAHRWLEDGRSMPLCPLGGGERPQAATTLQPGSLLILFTDGLIERRGASLSEQMDRLADVARDLRAAGAEEVCDGIMAHMVGDAPRGDDVVIVCVRYAPVVTRPPEPASGARPAPAPPAGPDAAGTAHAEGRVSAVVSRERAA